jgi:hypothetical protein
VFVISETVEHRDDPDATPIEAWNDANVEHVWAWDRDGVEEMMTGAGWTPQRFKTVDSREYGEPYCYGISHVE